MIDLSELVGFLALKHLTKKVVSQDYQFDSQIRKAVFKQFQRVKTDAILGLVARILETDEFVAVVNEANQFVGVITHLDLLNFASSSKKAGLIGNGTVHANGN